MVLTLGDVDKLEPAISLGMEKPVCMLHLYWDMFTVSTGAGS